MESYISLVCLSAGIFAPVLIILLLKCKKATDSMARNIPPGPPAWPIFGNIFYLLGTMPHQKLYNLRPKYGPVIWLKLGSVNTMVIQSANAAADFFKNHDLPYANRVVPDAMTAWSFDQASLGFAPYGAYWRMLRKIFSTELLVQRRLNDSTVIREKFIDRLVDWIEEEAAASPGLGGSGEVELPHLLFLMALNLVGNLILSRDLFDLKSKEGQEFFNAMNNVMVWAGKPNVADFWPFLKWLDPQRIKKNMVKDMGIAVNLAASFVKERSRQNISDSKNANKDFLDMLLEFKGDGKEWHDKISDHNISIIILEMFFGGSETTSSTIEWVLAELLRSPETMKKVKEELHRVIGPNKKIKESDIDKLSYLQAVVKETLRLHPALPLLLPRYSTKDTNYMGYLIPKGTQVFVNAWAIGRDPDVWEDPSSFKPERFLDSTIEYNGQNFEMIPFGSGRRICMGLDLAHRILHLCLATLLWSFDWQLDISSTPETMDMRERMGITLRKLVPLRAIPKKRLQ
ncbi:hypothetical protein AgCh_007964 [Apium graveolens]